MKTKTDSPLVLIVGGKPFELKELNTAFADENIEMIQAESLSGALKIAEGKKPDLILFDISEAGAAGLEGFKKFKENIIARGAPALILAGSGQEELLKKALKAGAADYIIRPFFAGGLKARVKNCLKSKFNQDKIEELNEKLKKLGEEKDEFLSIAAHDLKNPIYSVTMAAKVLKSDESLSRDEITEFASDIVITSERMLALIGNLLDINSIEQGKFKFNFESFEIRELIENISQNYHKSAAEKGISISLKFEEGVQAHADRVATIQILDNLISNAIKYSPYGKSVYISALHRGGNARIEVRDEGPGLTADDMKQLFGKFARLSAQPTGNESSTGLGLSIVKSYTEGMNGKVWCESEPGKGAAFIVELPKEPS